MCAPAGFTVSISQGKHTEAHSRRAYTPKSADKALQPRNVVIYDSGNDRVHFNDFFRPCREEANAKQKRSDRKVSLDYLEALELGIEGYGRGKKREQPFYQEVIQIGNRETNGVSDSTFDVDHWRQLKRERKYAEASRYALAHENHSKERQDFLEILTEIAEEIRDNKDGKYSNILVHGLIIHRDEPNGTDHLDFRYTIFTDGETRGPSKRVSMNKGLGAMGFRMNREQTALEQFRETLKNRIEEKMEERGYSRHVKGENRKHEPQEVYELEQRYKIAKAGIEAIEKREADLAEQERQNAQQRKANNDMAKELLRKSKKNDEIHDKAVETIKVAAGVLNETLSLRKKCVALLGDIQDQKKQEQFLREAREAEVHSRRIAQAMGTLGDVGRSINPDGTMEY